MDQNTKRIAAAFMGPLIALYRNVSSFRKPGAIAVTPEQFDALCDIVKETTDERPRSFESVVGEVEYIVSNPDGWGKGSTIAEAKSNYRKATKSRRLTMRVSMVPKGTIIEDMLHVSYPLDAKFHEMVEIK